SAILWQVNFLALFMATVLPFLKHPPRVPWNEEKQSEEGLGIRRILPRALQRLGLSIPHNNFLPGCGESMPWSNFLHRCGETCSNFLPGLGESILCSNFLPGLGESILCSNFLPGLGESILCSNFLPGCGETCRHQDVSSRSVKSPKVREKKMVPLM
uniref:Uncharacterized protein n=1 Tax=Paramormyrops kingsleyae TaxID=1676925 RepID=A0A3B3RTZ1_9TELE